MADSLWLESLYKEDKALGQFMAGLALAKESALDRAGFAVDILWLR